MGAVQAVFDFSPRPLAPERSRIRLARSTVHLHDLLAGLVSRDEIETATTAGGCGAVLVRLDAEWADIYSRFYTLQWQHGHRVLRDPAAHRRVETELTQLEPAIRHLLTRCAVAVARASLGRSGPTPTNLDLRDHNATRACETHVGRPLARNRIEFHPSVAWLVAQERHLPHHEPAPEVPVGTDREGRSIVGRPSAGERRLLALYREWERATPAEQRGHGDKFNGDIYYHAYRGRLHADHGGNLTALFGPGEIRDGSGRLPPRRSEPERHGGTLWTAPVGDTELVTLPVRLEDDSPYVVVMFEACDRVEADQRGIVCSDDLGWTPAVHCVPRIEDPTLSRGQVVQHVTLKPAHLALNL